MEEKERYKIDKSTNYYTNTIVDTKTNTYYGNIEEHIDLLNQQEKEIKQLAELYYELNKKYCEQQDDLIIAKGENQQLKQQLHDLPKKIVEDFYDEIRHRAILEDDYCPDHNLERKYGVRKCLLENIRTTILKKYGGEDE